LLYYFLDLAAVEFFLAVCGIAEQFARLFKRDKSLIFRIVNFLQVQGAFLTPAQQRITGPDIAENVVSKS